MSRGLGSDRVERALNRPADLLAWYALYCRARHERKVHHRLTERGVDAYLPLVSRISEWHDRKKVVEWPMFPGYIFVRADRDQLLTIEGRTAGVVGLVRHAGRPAPIAEAEMEVVRLLVGGLAETGESPQPEPLLGLGEEVEVDGGPFAGAVGRIVEVRGGGRLVVQVGLHAIRQGIRIELDSRWVRGHEKSTAAPLKDDNSGIGRCRRAS